MHSGVHTCTCSLAQTSFASAAIHVLDIGPAGFTCFLDLKNNPHVHVCRLTPTYRSKTTPVRNVYIALRPHKTL